MIQYKEYYPFGMETSESWTRTENLPANRYLFNGGSEWNSKAGIYETYYRGYDPALGRMTAIDPMALKYSGISPYNFAFNNPVSLNDPSGADAIITIDWDEVPEDGGYTIYFGNSITDISAVATYYMDDGELIRNTYYDVGVNSYPYYGSTGYSYQFYGELPTITENLGRIENIPSGFWNGFGDGFVGG
ncbi:MAG: hypothetical protein OEW75_07000, partial [Cyclobacteriaceae bacterium]|nr:hypothetical protein [Cyclobacteriaceae bacterium]